MENEVASDKSGSACYQQCFRHIDKPSGLIVDVEKWNLAEEIDARVAGSSFPDPKEGNASKETHPAVMLLQERIFTLRYAADERRCIHHLGTEGVASRMLSVKNEGLLEIGKHRYTHQTNPKHKVFTWGVLLFPTDVVLVENGATDHRGGMRDNAFVEERLLDVDILSRPLRHLPALKHPEPTAYDSDVLICIEKGCFFFEAIRERNVVMIKDRNKFPSGTGKQNVTARRDATVLRVVPEDNTGIVIRTNNFLKPRVVRRIIEQQKLKILKRLIQNRFNHFTQDGLRRVVERSKN